MEVNSKESVLLNQAFDTVYQGHVVIPLGNSAPALEGAENILAEFVYAQIREGFGVPVSRRKIREELKQSPEFNNNEVTFSLEDKRFVANTGADLPNHPYCESIRIPYRNGAIEITRLTGYGNSFPCGPTRIYASLVSREVKDQGLTEAVKDSTPDSRNFALAMLLAGGP